MLKPTKKLVIFIVGALGLLILMIGTNSLVIPANDARIYHTEWNWYVDKDLGVLETSNPGAYIKTSFTGSSIGVNFDAALLNFPYATLTWSIDDGPEQDYQLPSRSHFIQLASGLDNTKTHSLYLFVKNALQSQDRWFGPSIRIRITSFVIDVGAALVAPKLSPKRLLAFWDSIGEGVQVNCNTGDLACNDAHVTWAFSLAEAIDTELSLVAWGGQGYTVTGQGNVPILWNSNGEANFSAWKWINSKYPRSFDVCPDYILCGHGTNDGFRRQPEELVYTNTLGWLQEVRATCQASKIFLAVPFGRFMEGPIVRAYQSYQAAHPDEAAILVQLGEWGSQGLTSRGATFEAVDGLHPWYWKSSQLGALLAAEIVPHLSTRMLFELDEM